MALHRCRFAAFAALCLALPPAYAVTCPTVDKLSVQLPDGISAEFAGFVVPNSGLTGVTQYSEECLAVQVREGSANLDPLQELVNDRADVALCEGAHVAEKIANSADYTIIGSFYQLSSLALVGLNKAVLTSFEALKNKRIGLGRRGYEWPVRLMLKNSGVTQTSMIFTSDTSSKLLSNLNQGSIDVATATLYRDLGEVLRQLNPATQFLWQKDELAIFNTADNSAPALHNVIVVKTSRVALLRPKLVKFLKVAAKGWIKCRDNEATCMKALPYSSPLQRRLLRESLKLIFPSNDTKFGSLNSSAWAAVYNPLVTAGLIPSRVYDPIDNTLIGEAVANMGGLSASTLYSAGSLSLCASYKSEAPLRICVDQENKLCQQGYAPSALGICTACDPGRSNSNPDIEGNTRMNVCEPCVAGRYAAASGQTECDLCPKGEFRTVTDSSITQQLEEPPIKAFFTKQGGDPLQFNISNNKSLSDFIMDLTAGTSCVPCLVGRAAPSTGMSTCHSCSLAHFASGFGSSTCESCKDGSYATSLGTSACVTCPDNTTTRGNIAGYVYECACAEGFYRKANGNCVTCPMGFQCPIGSDEAVLRSFGTTGYVSGAYPHLLPGFWASKADPLSVYLCRNRKFCPGGSPQTCGPNMQDIACSLCEKGYFRQGEKCETCTGFDETEFNYPTLPWILGVIVIAALYFYMVDPVEKWTSFANELWTLAFLIIMYCQLVGLILSVNIPWPSPTYGTLYVWEYFLDVSEMLRLDCIRNSEAYRGFKDNYSLKTMQPLALLSIFLGVYLWGFVMGTIAHVLRGAGQKWFDNLLKAMGMARFTKVEPKLAVDPSLLFNNYMAIFQALYIPFCFMSLEIFMCYENPNGKQTLWFGPTVECNSEDWQRMLGESIMIALPVSIGAFAGLLGVAVVAPVFFDSKGFRSRWKFLLIRFRPDVWWWGPVLLFRALLLSLTHIFSQEGQRQLLWQLAILLTYTGCTAVLRPWRKWSTNILDVVVCTTLVIFLILHCNFVTHFGWLDDSIAGAGSIFTFVPAMVFLLLCFWTVLVGVAGAERGSEAKLAEDARAAFSKFVGLDKKASEAFIAKLSGQDRESIRRLWFMIVVELLKEPGRSRHYHWLTKIKAPAKKPGPTPDQTPTVSLDTSTATETSTYTQSPPKRVAPIPASRGSGELSQLRSAADNDPVSPKAKKNDNVVSVPISPKGEKKDDQV